MQLGLVEGAVELGPLTLGNIFSEIHPTSSSRCSHNASGPQMLTTSSCQPNWKRRRTTRLETAHVQARTALPPWLGLRLQVRLREHELRDRSEHEVILLNVRAYQPPRLSSAKYEAAHRGISRVSSEREAPAHRRRFFMMGETLRQQARLAAYHGYCWLAAPTSHCMGVVTGLLD